MDTTQLHAQLDPEEKVRRWGGPRRPGYSDEPEQHQAEPRNSRMREALKHLRATSPFVGDGEATQFL
jgi:hypothetical protein